MRASWQPWWRVGKVVVTVVILACVAWQFAQILQAPELWQGDWQLQPEWVAASAVLYLLGLACSALFWHRLLRALGQQPSVPGTMRAYYVGQLGRYVPGKVVSVVVRARLLSGPGVNQGVAVVTIIYEALTTLATGALLAALVLPFAADDGGRRWEALAFLAVVGVLLVPGVFNRIVRRLASACSENTAPPPRLRAATQAEGLAITTCGWAFQGASLWALLHALLPERPPFDLDMWAECTAFVALATLVGFPVITVPGGLGVRELVLQQLLTAELAAGLGAAQAAAASLVTVFLLRLVWVFAEVTAALALYWLPRRAPIGAPADGALTS